MLNLEVKIPSSKKEVAKTVQTSPKMQKQDKQKEQAANNIKHNMKFIQLMNGQNNPINQLKEV